MTGEGEKKLLFGVTRDRNRPRQAIAYANESKKSENPRKPGSEKTHRLIEKLREKGCSGWRLAGRGNIIEGGEDLRSFSANIVRAVWLCAC